MPLQIHLVLFASSLAAAAGQVFFKFGAMGRTALPAFVNPLVGTGLAFYSVSTALWVFALSKAPLSLVYPYTIVTFVAVYLASFTFFHEHLSTKALAGVLVALVGVILINQR